VKRYWLEERSTGVLDSKFDLFKLYSDGLLYYYPDNEKGTEEQY